MDSNENGIISWFVSRNNLEKGFISAGILTLILFISSNPQILSGFMILGGAAIALYVSRTTDQKRKAQLARLRSMLTIQPYPLNSLRNIKATLQGMTWLDLTQSQWFYNQSLEILAANQESTQAKEFALSVGRWHMSRSRKPQIITQYDELAIQNDIMIRSR
jgi:hypothetical protein